MTGYFNNLAIRTVSRGNLVEPRVASVFEPQGSLVSTVETGATSLATDFTDERKADSATTPISSNPRPAFSRNQTPAAGEPVSTVTTVATESFVEPTSPVDEPEFHVAEAPLAAGEAGAHVSQARTTTRAAARPAQSISSSNSVTQDEAPTSVVEVVSDEHVTTSEPQTTVHRTTKERVTNSQSRVQKPADRDEQKSVHLTEPEPSTAPSVKTVVHDATTTSTRQFSERFIKQTNTRREHLLLEAPPDPEPSINVTIGRVEVRATPTPSAKQKPARIASPVMPLEEYLRKQRRGEER